jgi:hypothetical protein
MEQRSLEEQQAALNLSQLSGHRDDGVATLIDAMIVGFDGPRSSKHSLTIHSHKPIPLLLA